MNCLIVHEPLIPASLTFQIHFVFIYILDITVYDNKMYLNKNLRL